MDKDRRRLDGIRRGPSGLQPAVTRALTRRIQSPSVCHMGWWGAALEVRTMPWKPAARQRSTTNSAMSLPTASSSKRVRSGV